MQFLLESWCIHTVTKSDGCSVPTQKEVFRSVCVLQPFHYPAMAFLHDLESWLSNTFCLRTIQSSSNCVYFVRRIKTNNHNMCAKMCCELAKRPFYINVQYMVFSLFSSTTCKRVFQIDGALCGHHCLLYLLSALQYNLWFGWCSSYTLCQKDTLWRVYNVYWKSLFWCIGQHPTNLEKVSGMDIRFLRVRPWDLKFRTLLSHCENCFHVSNVVPITQGKKSTSHRKVSIQWKQWFRKKETNSSTAC